MDALEQLISAQTAVTAVLEDVLLLLGAVMANLASRAPVPEIQHSSYMAGKLYGPLVALHTGFETQAAELQAIKATAEAEAFQRGYDARRAEERPALQLAVP